jgi:hypothetical protein
MTITASTTTTTTTGTRSVVGVIATREGLRNTTMGNRVFRVTFTDGRSYVTRANNSSTDTVQGMYPGERVALTLSPRGTIVAAHNVYARREVTTMVGRTGAGDRVYVTMALAPTTGASESTGHDQLAAGETMTFRASGYVVARGQRNACIAGQCVGELDDVVTPADGWTLADVRELATLWRVWHLSDMRAGCDHQYGLNDRPCGTTGYRYGSAWLTRVMPTFTLSALARIVALPVTATPASY